MSDKPFIHLFHNQGGFFFYDVNKNRVVKIRESFYWALYEKELGESDEYLLFDEYESLKKEGYLSVNRPTMIRNPLTDYIHTYLNKYLNNLVLQVTQGCNLRCTYCYYSGDGTFTRKHTNAAMSWNVAKDALDFFKEHAEESDDVTIGFYGGEPLLNFSLIKKCVEYANKIMGDKKVQFAVTTNGTVLNEEIIAFMEKHSFSLLLSIDGPKEINDINRRYAVDGKGTFDKIYSNLKLLREKAPDYYLKTEINAVISNDKDYMKTKSFFETDELFKQLKVHLSKVQDALLNENYADTPDFLCAEKTDLFKNLLLEISGNKNNVERRNEKSLVYMRDFFETTDELPKIFHHRGPCVPGYEKLFVNILGDFYPCVNASEKSEVLKFGNLSLGFDYKRIIDMLNIGKLTESECMNCKAMRFCTICQNEVDNLSELSVELKKSKCLGITGKFDELLNDYSVYRTLGVI